MRIDKEIALFLCVVAFLVLAPFVFYSIFIMKILCLALFAAAVNLLLGYMGILSLGHAAFFGTAGYVAAHSIKEWGVPVEVGIIGATLAATSLGLVVGWLAIRRAGIYLAMITLAMAQMVYFLYVQAPFTGGEDGLQGVPRGYLLGVLDLSNNMNLYYFVLAIFVAGYWLTYRVVNSPFGQIMRAVGENEDRATSLGYNPARFKLMVFVLSAGLAGVAGATKAVVFQFATLTDAHWHTSGEVVLMTLVGGLGTFLGPFVGAGTLVSLEHMLSDKVGSLIPVIMGVIFVVCVLVFRRGIVGELAFRLGGSRIFKGRIPVSAKTNSASEDPTESTSRIRR